MAETSVINQCHLFDRKKPLKLFGIQVFEDEDTDPNYTKLGGAGSSESGTSTAGRDGRRYECHYCFREFANSQALGGHQNAHKKERQQLKRAQMHVGRNPAAIIYGLQTVQAGSIIFSPHASRTGYDSSCEVRNYLQPAVMGPTPRRSGHWIYPTPLPESGGSPFMAFHGSGAQLQAPPTCTYQEPMFPVGRSGSSHPSTPYSPLEFYMSSSSSSFSGEKDIIPPPMNSNKEVGVDLHLSLKPALP